MLSVGPKWGGANVISLHDGGLYYQVSDEVQAVFEGGRQTGWRRRPQADEAMPTLWGPRPCRQTGRCHRFAAMYNQGLSKVDPKVPAASCLPAECQGRVPAEAVPLAALGPRWCTPTHRACVDGCGPRNDRATARSIDGAHMLMGRAEAGDDQDGTTSSMGGH